MKRICIVLLLIAGTTAASAQTWNEWFNQRRTQIRYLLQQIAANQVYLEQLQKGYSIARNGLTSLRGIQDGHFRLDDGFFRSLEQVNPHVRNYARAADIVALNNKVVAVRRRALKVVHDQRYFTAREAQYVAGVYTRLLADGENDLDDLVTVLLPGGLEMNDEERIKRIDALFVEVQSKYGFANQFCTDLEILARQRQAEQMELLRLQGLQSK